MKMYSKFALFAFVAAGISFSGCGGKKLEPVCDGSNLTYDTGINTIINTNCATSGCHNAGSGDGDFTTYAGLSTVTSNGKFFDAVMKRQTMPQGDNLTQDELNKLQCWVEGGYKKN